MSIQSALTAMQTACLALPIILVFPVELPANDDVAAKLKAFEETHLSLGRFRTEQHPEDAPFTEEDLTRNFLEIALKRAPARDGSRTDAKPDDVVMRWEGPIRYRLHGDGVTDEHVAAYAAYAKTLSALTGVSVEMSETHTNLKILVVGPEMRRDIGDQLETHSKDGQLEAFRAWIGDDNDPCHGYFGADEDHVIVKGVILIRTEVKGLTREACIQEELGQLLGLVNESRDARPSIFNDDQEFIRLTRHDQYLLRILYDERLRPGMTADELAPILPQVVDDVFPGG